MNPQILKALNPRAAFDTTGAMLMVPAVRSPRNAKAAKVVVSKSDSSVSAFDAQGQLLARYPASSGSEHDPLPIGNWKITARLQNLKFFYNLISSGTPTQTSQGRNQTRPHNPVGLSLDRSLEAALRNSRPPEPRKSAKPNRHGSSA